MFQSHQALDIKQRREQPLAQGEQKTVQLREFKGVNLTDARTAIADGEFSWLENAMPVGSGNVKLVPGVGIEVTHALLTDVVKAFGFVLNNASYNNVPIVLCVNSDGSVAQVRLDTLAVSAVTGAGGVTAGVQMTMWKSTDVLMVDPVKGYLSWDGTTFTVRDAAKTGESIAVFRGYVWISGTGAARRTITFSAPDSFTDFSGANGGGTFVVNDSVFIDGITRLISALEQLWIVGPGAVEAITNVSTTGSPLTTTFSVTNIVSNVGSTFPSSVNTFLRTVVFLTPYGVYAIVGSTPQKLSDKLDGLFADLDLSADVPSAVGTINNVFSWMALVQYMVPLTDPVVTRPLLVCFSQGKWFFASEPDIRWITGVVRNGVPEVWAAKSDRIVLLFADPAASVDYLIQTKLFDFGSWTTPKELLRVGLEFTSELPVEPDLTLENENRSVARTITAFASNEITFTGSGLITFQGTGDIVFVAAGFSFVRRAVGMVGRYLGLTLSGTEPQWTLSGLAMEVRPGGPWN